ncbi:MAG: AraC family transcriptional regulator [Rubripirellula sp.]|nr:AraC family transcriptional regulator [Rubripirellula sp.]
MNVANAELGSGSMAVAPLDPVSTLLHGAYFPNWSATELNLERTWSFEVPSKRGCLYVILQGEAWLVPSDSEMPAVHLRAGDHLVVTRGFSHRICSSPEVRSVSIDLAIAEPTTVPSPTLVPPSDLVSVEGEGALVGDVVAGVSKETERTAILYGQFEITDVSANPLDIGLPDMVRLMQDREPTLSLCQPMLAMIQSARRDRPVGWSVVVRRLSELILLQTVASALESRAAESSDSNSGVFRMMRAATDAVIGPVLRVMVEKPEAPWTVPQMARLGKVSKSAFSDRFRRLVGLPPLQYLTEIRMGKSRRLLRDSDVEIGEIAYLVGYESPSSFSNVFKRWHGISPIEYRRTKSDIL